MGHTDFMDHGGASSVSDVVERLAIIIFESTERALWEECISAAEAILARFDVYETSIDDL